MNIHYHLIINPTAGGNKAQKTADRLISFLQAEKLVYSLYYSDYPQHEAKIASYLKEHTLRSWQDYQNQNGPFPLVVVVGGDGTLHQVINQLKADIPFAYIPAGTGNDFARSLTMPKDIEQIFKHLTAIQQPQTINLLAYQAEESQQISVCVNNLGIGLDANIVYTTNHSKAKNSLNRFNLSSFSYIRSLFSVLFKQAGFPLQIEYNGQKKKFSQAFLCTVTNHPYFGGGVKIAPMADVYENKVDLVVVERIAIVKIFYLIILLLLQKHTHSKYFHHLKSEQFHLISSSPQYLQADGEDEAPAAHNLIITTRKQLFWY